MSGPFPVETLRAALAGRGGDAGPVGRRLEYHARIRSTNDRARELAASGEPEGTVVLSDEQTRGRGRGGRSWHSPPGLGLYLSIILRPEAPPGSAPLFGLMAAVAAAEALAPLAAAPVLIKWPNDLVVPAGSEGTRRKIAGILPEARASADAIRDLVIGIGINVNQEERDFPPDLAGRAASLRMVRGRAADRVEVAIAVLTAIDAWYTLWSRDGEGPILDRYRGLAPDLDGSRVRVTDGRQSWTGRTAGVTAGGALRVRPDEPGGSGAPIVTIRYGEVRRVEEA